jgi:hypothetical protein
VFGDLQHRPWQAELETKEKCIFSDDPRVPSRDFHGEVIFMVKTQGEVRLSRVKI